MAHDVFISHSAKDRSLAEATAAFLEERGIPCWFLPRNLTAGEGWADAIVRAIQESKLMVLIMSDSANESHQIEHEVERAYHYRVPILPVRTSGFPLAPNLEYYLPPSQWMDATETPFERHLLHLADSVQRLLKQAPEPLPPPSSMRVEPSGLRIMTHDVFISFKNLDARGAPTRDSQLAKEIYDSLKGKGVYVFRSTETLEELGESDYRRAIDEALDAASIVVAVGTSVENLDSEWVRYEWSSFHNDILSGVNPKGKIFTYIEGLLPRQLPRTLRQTQTFTHSPEALQHLHGFIVRALAQSERGNVAAALPLEAVPGPPAASVASSSSRPRVFLSHTAEDIAYAAALEKAILQAGFDVYSMAHSRSVGDDWERELAREINDCAFFVPIISQNTEKREVGFFRKEWYLASERSLTTDPQMPFILPVLVGDIADPQFIPEQFRKIQGIRMEGTAVPPDFTEFFLRRQQR